MSEHRGPESPLREILAIGQRMNRMLDESFGFNIGARQSDDAWDETCRPPVDLVETTEAFVFRVELPGVTREEIELEVEQRQVAIRGAKRLTREVDQTRYHRMECAYGRFERRFQLPVDLDAERVQANLKDGVLTIRVAKVHNQVSRRIEIQE